VEYGVRIQRTLLQDSLIRRSSYSRLGLSPLAVKNNLGVAIGFAKLIERMRQQAQEEAYAASEWIKWLKYGKFSSLHVADDRNRKNSSTRYQYRYFPALFMRYEISLVFPEKRIRQISAASPLPTTIQTATTRRYPS